MNILHLDSSITGENSVSRALSAKIVRQLRGTNVTYRDLVATPFDHLTLPGYTTDESQAALDEFFAADTVVIGAAMYNFTIPTQLKAWFDRILVAGQTFRYTESGPEGLAGGKRVIVALARGNFYGAETPLRDIEHAERYLRTVLGFIGITDPTFVIAEGLAISPEQRALAMEQASRDIDNLTAATLVH